MRHPQYSTQGGESVNPQIKSALEMVRRGFQPIPLRANSKRPGISAWEKTRFDPTKKGLAKAKSEFENWAAQGFTNLGVLCGAPSGDLIDIDLDHPRAKRLAMLLLPFTAARSGRENSPSSHLWFLAEPDTLQSSATYKLPASESGAMLIEYRSTGMQTAVAPSVHPDGDNYVWESEPWGGEEGPTRVNGQALALDVAMVGLSSLLVENWPGAGGRHDAYLALAGSLLHSTPEIFGFWSKNLPILIDALASETEDDDGAYSRVSESISSTQRRISNGGTVRSWGTLAEYIGDGAVRQVKTHLDSLEKYAGLDSRLNYSPSRLQDPKAGKEKKEIPTGPLGRTSLGSSEQILSVGDDSERKNNSGNDEDETDTEEEDENPLDSRISSWEAVTLEPYISGQIEPPKPTILERSDGKCLFYPGRLNMLYGPSEAAKSWLAMTTAIQVLERGGKVMYLDFEDEPVNALNRMILLGAREDDLRFRFSYVRPEEPLAPMQRNRWGEAAATSQGEINEEIFQKMLRDVDPNLIVADGMTMLYGLHGLDTNSSSQTDIITSWLKSLSRNGRSTVIVIDHTGKGVQRGSRPIGSQHKESMVQGTMLQTYPKKQPVPGSIGEVELIVLKDRPGEVRAISEKIGEKAQQAALFVMDSTQEGKVVASILPPKAGRKSQNDNGDDSLRQGLSVEATKENVRMEKQRLQREAILDLFGGDLDLALSIPKMYETLGNHPHFPSKEKQAILQAIRRAVERLESAGDLTRTKKSSPHTFTLVASYDLGENDEQSNGKI